MTFLTLLCALALSGIAAYYSIIGLAAIFTGAFWPIVFMGSVLEASKLVTTSWLYRNWKTCPFLLKTYLTTAVVILMLITSMGIFGFLSKAHIDSTLDSGANMVEVKTLNAQEKITKERLEYLLLRAKDPSTASNRLDKQIQDTQKELNEITKKKLPLLKESNKLVAEVGPIKYVGDMIYGVEDDNAIDKAVRLVIMLIMIVFDPLAVLLLIAANMNIKQKEETVVIEDTVVEVKQEPEPVPFVTQEVKEVIPEVVVEEDTGPQLTEEFKQHMAKWKTKEDTVEIPAENITKIEEPQPIVIDNVNGETIPPLGQSPGVQITTEEFDETEGSSKKRGFPNRKSKIDSMYVDDAELAFRKKENK
jgi:hypothetical protein